MSLFYYSVFGLHLEANQPIPGLMALPTTLSVDVCLYLLEPWLNKMPDGPQESWYISCYQDEQNQPLYRVWKLARGEYFRFLYSDGTEFVIDRAGTRVWATWSDPMTLEDTATYLLGPILGFVLRLRDLTCLHASAIAVGDQAIALLGPAGAGKSTTAAAFAKLGYPVLSDDVVTLVDRGDTFLVQPAYPRLRLWSESVKALYGSPDALPRIVPTHPTWDKRYLDLIQNRYQFQQHSLPLAAVYILGGRSNDSTAPFVEAVATHASLIVLVANTYANYLLDKEMRAQEFELLSRLVINVPLRQVTPHADPVYLSKLCDVILDDFQALTSSALVVTGSKQG
jgi:hypothetical protein